MSSLRQFVLTTALVLGATANERPNIILVMADDMGWGATSNNRGWIAPLLSTPWPPKT